MPRYRRVIRPGGTFFLTLVSYRRRPIFDDASARRCLRCAIAAARDARPFTLMQLVLLPDHLHLILQLPANDADFSTRIASIKAGFTRSWSGTGGHGESAPAGSASRNRQRYRDVWQKRFWEHTVRDRADLARCEAYVWFNPVKHGLAACPHAWPWSSFHRELRAERMREDWRCVCDGRPSLPQPFDLPGAEMDRAAEE